MTDTSPGYIKVPDGLFDLGLSYGACGLYLTIYCFAQARGYCDMSMLEPHLRPRGRMNEFIGAREELIRAGLLVIERGQGDERLVPILPPAPAPRPGNEPLQAGSNGGE